MSHVLLVTRARNGPACELSHNAPRRVDRVVFEHSFRTGSIRVHPRADARGTKERNHLTQRAEFVITERTVNSYMACFSGHAGGSKEDDMMCGRGRTGLRR